jgi:hypothetical protein
MQGTCNSLNAIRCDGERQRSRYQLTYAFKAPEWDFLCMLAGQPRVRGELIWTVKNRTAVIVARRGAEQFKETVE